MLISQDTIFEGLDFEKCEFENVVCYKGRDGGYYRIDHFGGVYVIEFAENVEEAKLNRFEDTDTYSDTISTNELIEKIRSDLKKFAS